MSQPQNPSEITKATSLVLVKPSGSKRANQAIKLLNEAVHQWGQPKMYTCCKNSVFMAQEFKDFVKESGGELHNATVTTDNHQANDTAEAIAKVAHDWIAKIMTERDQGDCMPWCYKFRNFFNAATIAAHLYWHRILWRLTAYTTGTRGHAK
ncbi:hypothetical protein SARC_05762 [Sphaeroforma arctica JP610]|uniref:Integrase catalytic domain-containing protein n=1 Tax=Sphaeroforma arctica JP610 TaxID=667725 RepID=A0A0L0FZ88_9EUKA|nr:hypothetical protein SARC_05762 [Sphaeroforma arctica JP610]KNC81949.1 hypothetical protein SARC_05762 [Sphaeroforma arctica JP610]|eukprot:XP_014155851.1 hypothetical protein SARC_05762 [Sphaeroforma arctica JP610]